MKSRTWQNTSTEGWRGNFLYEIFETPTRLHSRAKYVLYRQKDAYKSVYPLQFSVCRSPASINIRSVENQRLTSKFFDNAAILIEQLKELSKWNFCFRVEINCEKSLWLAGIRLKFGNWKIRTRAIEHACLKSWFVLLFQNIQASRILSIFFDTETMYQ